MLPWMKWSAAAAVRDEISSVRKISPSTVAASVEQGRVFSEADIQKAPRSSNGQSMPFVFNDLVVARHDGTRYQVGNAVCRPTMSLSDSGAAQSLIAEDVLAQLPSDAVVRRLTQKVRASNVNANGGAIYSTGTATIVFTIDGLPFEWTFKVIVGGQLTLLGTDFLRAHAASLGFDSAGAAWMFLQHKGQRKPVSVVASN